MADENEYRIDAGESTRGFYPDANSDGTFLSKEFNGFSVDALRAILLNVNELTSKALVKFDETEQDHVKLNLVGAVLHALAEMYNKNIETLKYWHDLICTMPKLTAELNEELSVLLGHPVDISNLPDEQVEALFNEVIEKATSQDLDRLREYMERKSQEN
jgi:hypothetical protein